MSFQGLPFVSGRFACRHPCLCDRSLVMRFARALWVDIAGLDRWGVYLGWVAERMGRKCCT